MKAQEMRKLILFDHRNAFFVTLATILSAFSLQLTPSTVPIVLSLSALLVYSRPLLRRPGTLKNSFLLWLGLAVGSSLPKLPASLSALSSSGISLLVLFTASAFTSFIALIPVFLDAIVCMHLPSSWAQVVFFPAIWATIWSGVASLSPIGHLSTWSPVQGTGTYSWLSSFLGPAAIDWTVAAWAVVLSKVVEAWLMNESSDSDSEELLFHHHHIDSHALKEPIHSAQFKSARLLATILVILAIPSLCASSYPQPILSQHTTPLSVGCVLPPFKRYKHHSLTLDDYLAESQKLTSLAKILLWPEGAVVFNTELERDAAFKRVRQVITGSFVGVSFEESFADPKDKTGVTGARRTGLALISKSSDTPHLVYYKRKLVPIAESFSLTHSEEPPDMFTIELPHPKDVNKTDWAPGPNYTRPLPVTTSICLDFTAPLPFANLPSRPALILAPARTWDINVGFAMWNQAKQRAEELGTMVLWCDGGNGGVSGVAGNGMNDIQQVGPGSWFRTVGVDYPHQESRTVYATIGNHSLWLLWLIVGIPISKRTVHFLPYGVTVAKVRDFGSFVISRLGKGSGSDLARESERGAPRDLLD
ncbi:hypothetical protein AX17_000190 [Amanita inopinata Kibby_2008]|nr:hypothetical protein AX17_000190 [Amanita inopinata Kibby_2008]